MRQTTEKSKVCFGIQSNTEDNKHIFMADFDDMPLSNVRDVLSHMQQIYSLSEIYILKTERGYNAFSFDKLELDFLVSLLSNYNPIDPQFIALAKKRGFFVLRMGQEKRQIGSLFSKPHNYIHELSNAHYQFFREIMQYVLLRIGNFDNYSKFNIIAYRSNKNGWCNVKLQ